MRLAFFGNPEISARLLCELLKQKEDEIVYVITNPPKSNKRSTTPTPSPVEKIIRAHHIQKHTLSPHLIYTPNFKDSQEIEKLVAYKIDVLIVFAFGIILPQAALNLASKGALNLHASLLPQLRGASPIQSSLLENLSKTGWSVQYMNTELDAGDIILQNELEIEPNENCAELTERLLPLGISLLKESIDLVREGKAKKMSIPQAQITSTPISYCKKIKKEDAQINWSRNTQDIHNQIRAYNPKPLAWTLLDNKKLLLYQAKIIPQTQWEIEKAWLSPPYLNWNELPMGYMNLVRPNKKDIEEGNRRATRELWVKTGDGVLSLLEVQLENRKPMKSESFINGLRNFPYSLGKTV